MEEFLQDEIAARTRTKVSLEDIEIEDLEDFLDDEIDMPNVDDPDHLEYQRFLASLLPNATAAPFDDYAELAIEDEEFEPLAEDDNDEDDCNDESTSISREELTDLLCDSSTVTKSSPISQSLPLLQPNSKYSRIHGTVTSLQCIQLASQLHKHVQLLAQSLAICHNALEDPRDRPSQKSAKALNTLRMKLDNMVCGIQSLASTPVEMPMQNALIDRPVTRSLAFKYPSMFEITGIGMFYQLVQKLKVFLKVRTEMTLKSENAEPFHVDPHLLPPGSTDLALVKARSDSSTRAVFSKVEDRLLARGSQQLGRSFTTDQYMQLCKAFLPTRAPTVTRNRYRYLLTSKAPANPVQQWHKSTPVNSASRAWTPYEDIHLVRGMINSTDGKQTPENLLPYRSRIQVRKRWDRLRPALLFPERNEIDPVLVEDFLSKAIPEPDPKVENPVVEDQIIQSYQLKAGRCDDTIESSPCLLSNLHAGLFYTRWARLEPSVLLRNSCNHNWPSTCVDPGGVDSDATEYSEIEPGSDEEDSEFEQDQLDSEDDEEADSQDDFEYDEVSSSDEEIPVRNPTEIAWTKDQDKAILIAAKAYGAHDTTWKQLTQHPKLRDVGIDFEAIRDRYRELIATLLQSKMQQSVI